MRVETPAPTAGVLHSGSRAVGSAEREVFGSALQMACGRKIARPPGPTPTT
jgi:hypothetical protein